MDWGILCPLLAQVSKGDTSEFTTLVLTLLGAGGVGTYVIKKMVDYYLKHAKEEGTRKRNMERELIDAQKELVGELRSQIKTSNESLKATQEIERTNSQNSALQTTVLQGIKDSLDRNTEAVKVMHSDITDRLTNPRHLTSLLKEQERNSHAKRAPRKQV